MLTLKVALLPSQNTLAAVLYCDKMKTSPHLIHSFLSVSTLHGKGATVVILCVVHLLGSYSSVTLRSYGTSVKLVSMVSVCVVVFMM